MRLVVEDSWAEPYTKVWIVEDGMAQCILRVKDGRMDGEYIPPEKFGETVEPSFIIGYGQFKYLYEAFAKLAWERGWRPEDFIPNDATTKHLEDMRKLVSWKFGVTL